MQSICVYCIATSLACLLCAVNLHCIDTDNCTSLYMVFGKDNTRSIQKVHRLFNSVLQVKCTWSEVSPELGFHCRRIVDLGLSASRLPFS